MLEIHAEDVQLLGPKPAQNQAYTPAAGTGQPAVNAAPAAVPNQAPVAAPAAPAQNNGGFITPQNNTQQNVASTFTPAQPAQVDQGIGAPAVAPAGAETDAPFSTPVNVPAGV
jgi:hypothetical protein